MTPAEFRAAGELIYGPSWRASLAAALGISERTVRRFQNDNAIIPDSIRRDLSVICFDRAIALAKVGVEIATPILEADLARARAKSNELGKLLFFSLKGKPE